MLRNTPVLYGLVAIALHWLIGLLFIGQIALGLTMERLDDQRRAFELIQLHKSFGFLLLALILLRIVWRISNIQPELPPGMSRPERRAARFSHLALYALMLLLPLTGWILVSVSTLGIPTFAFNRFLIPHLPLPASDASEDFWASVHTLLGYAAAGLVTIHILAALWHQFIRRDGLLVRMLWPAREDRGRSQR